MFWKHNFVIGLSLPFLLHWHHKPVQLACLDQSENIYSLRASFSLSKQFWWASVHSQVNIYNILYYWIGHWGQPTTYEFAVVVHHSHTQRIKFIRWFYLRYGFYFDLQGWMPFLEWSNPSTALKAIESVFSHVECKAGILETLALAKDLLIIPSCNKYVIVVTNYNCLFGRVFAPSHTGK